MSNQPARLAITTIYSSPRSSPVKYATLSEHADCILSLQLQVQLQFIPSLFIIPTTTRANPLRLIMSRLKLILSPHLALKHLATLEPAARPYQYPRDVQVTIDPHYYKHDTLGSLLPSHNPNANTSSTSAFDSKVASNTNADRSALRPATLQTPEVYPL